MSHLTAQTTVHEAKLDALVATYAPLGRRKKRRQALRNSLVAAGLFAAAAASFYLGAADTSWLRTLPGFESAVSAGRLARIEQQIADVQAIKNTLEAQQAEVRAQAERISMLLMRADNEEAVLAAQQQHGNLLDQEIEAIAAQRRALTERWQQFEAQGELLALEIMAVTAQRKELESQRRQIDQQQRELARLLDRAEGLYRRATGTTHDQTADKAVPQRADDDSFTYTYNSLVPDATDFELVVDNTELDELRGGFSIGEGLDVSFGFSQTGAINGVEQFNNYFTIDSMASGFEIVDMANMNTVVLQNGDGNYVSPGVLESLADVEIH